MLAFSSLLGNVEGQNIYRIWYDKPASYWEEALPVGNGRIAAMVFGDPQLEQIQLNEETVSAGSPYQNYNEEAKTALPEMRRLIFEGKYEEAQNMAATKILSQVGNEMPYQTVGRLNIRYQDHKKVNNYYRDDLEKNGMKLSGLSPDGRIVEMLEIPEHPWFVATQAHPECKSRPNHPHPLFKGFVGAALEYQDK